MSDKDVRALTLRLEPKQLERIDRLNHQLGRTRRFEPWAPGQPVPARSDFIRWLLELGMAQVEKTLKKEGTR
jgi:hypothetical protein